MPGNKRKFTDLRRAGNKKDQPKLNFTSTDPIPSMEADTIEITIGCDESSSDISNVKICQEHIQHFNLLQGLQMKNSLLCPLKLC